jgi:uncharacterized DUF497 family protein
MRVEWDRAKNDINQTKHGIDFETAQLVFDDPCCVTFVERVTDGEERWRPATRRERKLYAQAIG